MASKYGEFIKSGGRTNNSKNYNRNYYEANKSKWKTYREKAIALRGLEKKDARDEARERANQEYAKLVDQVRSKDFGAFNNFQDYMRIGADYVKSKQAFYEAQDIYSQTFLGKVEGYKREALSFINFCGTLKIKDIDGPWKLNEELNKGNKRDYARTTDYGRLDAPYGRRKPKARHRRNVTNPSTAVTKRKKVKHLWSITK